MKRRLELAKTQDFCNCDSPRLTVVMIHGIASNSSTFDSALGFFREDEKLREIRFVTFDLLGMGKSLKDDKLEYNYREQLEALDNSIEALGLSTPLVLIGHSLGTFIVTRYTRQHPDKVAKLILISPPIYTEQDFDNPAFQLGIDAFKKLVSVKNPQILNEKSFTSSMDKIVLDRRNYDVLAGLTTPTTLVYGASDQLISSYNIPKLLKENKQITAIKTIGRHGVTKDKYSEIAELLEEAL